MDLAIGLIAGWMIGIATAWAMDSAAERRQRQRRLGNSR